MRSEKRFTRTCVEESNRGGRRFPGTGAWGHAVGVGRGRAEDHFRLGQDARGARVEDDPATEAFVLDAEGLAAASGGIGDRAFVADAG
jgi:hypothetical protein